MDDHQVNEVLDMILQEVRSLHGRFDRLEERVESIDQRLDAVEQRMDTVEHSLEQVQGRLAAVEERVRDVDCRVVHVEHVLEEFPQMRQAILEIAARTIGIDRRLQQVEANMVSKADLAFYDRKIGGTIGRFI